jgi:putative sterol carrier protein
VQPFDTGNADITMEVEEQVWKELAAQIRNPIKTFLKGEIKVNGGQLAFKKFMDLFDLAFEE